MKKKHHVNKSVIRWKAYCIASVVLLQFKALPRKVSNIIKGHEGARGSRRNKGSPPYKYRMLSWC